MKVLNTGNVYREVEQGTKEWYDEVERSLETLINNPRTPHTVLEQLDQANANIKISFFIGGFAAFGIFLLNTKMIALEERLDRLEDKTYKSGGS